jgi:hypothetical protein
MLRQQLEQIPILQMAKLRLRGSECHWPSKYQIQQLRGGEQGAGDFGARLLGFESFLLCCPRWPWTFSPRVTMTVVRQHVQQDLLFSISVNLGLRVHGPMPQLLHCKVETGHCECLLRFCRVV